MMVKWSCQVNAICNIIYTNIRVGHEDAIRRYRIPLQPSQPFTHANMPTESGNMVIMALSYAQRTDDISWLKTYVNICSNAQ